MNSPRRPRSKNWLGVTLEPSKHGHQYWCCILLNPFTQISILGGGIPEGWVAQFSAGRWLSITSPCFKSERSARKWVERRLQQVASSMLRVCIWPGDKQR